MKKLLLILIACISLHGTAQTEQKIELTEFIKDIQIFESNDGDMSLTFWIPRSYWKVALEGREDVTQESITLIEDAFKDYELVCVLNGSSNSNGTFDFQSESDMRKELHIKDANGKKYKALDQDDLTEIVVYFDAMIKPMFSQMFGQMGEGMHFFYFEIKDKQGENLINEFEEGEFTVYHSDKAFKYMLPLPSLLATKSCPVDNEEMKGNWKFCPIHGDALAE